MIQKIGRRKFKVFAYDVESHNDDESIAKGETSIWLSSFIDEDSKEEDEANYFYTIESWLDHIEEISNPKRTRKTRPIKNICIYIFNAGFEWSFIFPKLLERGFKFKDVIEKEDEYVYNSTCTRSVSSLWRATMKFNKKGGIVEIRDLGKIFSGSLRKVAQSFGLPTQKGDLDYKLNRLHGHTVTKEEKSYCFKDTRIIVDILLEMQRRKDTDFWNSISAASYSCRKMIKRGYQRTYHPMRAFRLDDQYPLLGEDESTFLRAGVAGGLTYATKRWQFKDIKKDIKHIDMHSAHPTSLFCNLFPFGYGEYFIGKPPTGCFRISCVHVRVSYSNAKLHSIIALIGIDIVDDMELTLWDFEIPTMYKCYEDLKIEYIDGYAYHARLLPWRDYYNDCFNNRLKAKAEDDAFLSMYYKLLLNSSYGKLLERGHFEVFENCLDEDGHITSNVIEKPEAPINAKYTYLPVGSACPAYTRVRLVETALLFGIDNIVYFDTDSIFVIESPTFEEDIKKVNMQNELGGWGYEPDITRAQFSAPKRYKIVEKKGDKEELTIHMAGINFETMDDIDYDDLDILEGRYEIKGKAKAKGGTLIVLKEKHIEVQPKYRIVYETNKDEI